MADNAPQLVDRFNRPLRATKALLSEEVARPGLTGVRQAWNPETAVMGLTPDRLDAILREANHGDMRAFLTLAEEMEERDPHYGSVLQTRKLAVLGLERKLSWGAGKETHPRAPEILAGCQALVEAPAFDDLLHHLMDAVAKGYAAPEMIWDTSAAPWRPVKYKWRDPRFFRLDRETGEELRLLDPGEPDGLPLPPYKFAVHVATRKSGLVARAGLARLVAFSFVCKLYGLKDWMAYAEIFGIPLRLGRYDGSASATDVEILKRAVFGLGSDAAAVIPKSMDIEFPDLGQATGGAELFHALVLWLDNQVSKAVLGQTGTADMQKGGGYAQAKVQDEVRSDLKRADAKALGATITSDVFAPFVAFNWGPDAPVPSLEIIVPEPEDTVALADALQKLVPLGLKVDQAEIRRKLKLSEPAPNADVLAPPAQAAAPADPALARDGRRSALARTSPPTAQPDLEELQLAELEGWERTFGPEAGQVMDLVKSAGSFEEITAGLEAMAKDLAAPAAARSLARAMFAAAVLGQGPDGRKGS